MINNRTRVAAPSPHLPKECWSRCEWARRNLCVERRRHRFYVYHVVVEPINDLSFLTSGCTMCPKEKGDFVNMDCYVNTKIMVALFRQMRRHKLIATTLTFNGSETRPLNNMWIVLYLLNDDFFFFFWWHTLLGHSSIYFISKCLVFYFLELWQQGSKRKDLSKSIILGNNNKSETTRPYFCGKMKPWKLWYPIPKYKN